MPKAKSVAGSAHQATVVGWVIVALLLLLTLASLYRSPKLFHDACRALQLPTSVCGQAPVRIANNSGEQVECPQGYLCSADGLFSPTGHTVICGGGPGMVEEAPNAPVYCRVNNSRSPQMGYCYRCRAIATGQ